MAGGLTRLEQAAMLPRPTRSTLVSKLSNDPSGRIGKLFNQVRPIPQDGVFWCFDATRELSQCPACGLRAGHTVPAAGSPAALFCHSSIALRKAADGC